MRPVAIICVDGTALVVPSSAIAERMTAIAAQSIAVAVKAHDSGGPVMSRSRILQTGHPPSHPEGYTCTWKTSWKSAKVHTFSCRGDLLSSKSPLLFAFCYYSEDIDLTASTYYDSIEAMPKYMQTIAEAISGHQRTQQGSSAPMLACISASAVATAHNSAQKIDGIDEAFATNPEMLQRFTNDSNSFGLEAEALVAAAAQTIAIKDGGVSSLKASLNVHGCSFDFTLEATKEHLRLVLTRWFRDLKKVDTIMKLRVFAQKSERSKCTLKVEIVST